jgi:voltage-gated potassium channel Kch
MSGNNEESAIVVDEDQKSQQDSGAGTVVICGFGDVGETVAQCLEKANEASSDGYRKGINYLAFDLGPEEVIAGYKNGFKIMYGDGSQRSVLSTAGIENPRAFVVTYRDPEVSIKTVERLHQSYPSTPIYARASDKSHFFEVMTTGAKRAVQDDRESSFELTSSLLVDLGMKLPEINEISRELKLALEVRDIEYLNRLR